MWNDTAVTRKLGIVYPIVQGPFGGGLSSTQLAATVSNAGGLGSFGAHHLAPEKMAPLVAELRALTDRPFAINLWVSAQDEAASSFSRAEYAMHMARLKPYFDELELVPPEFPTKFGENFDDQIEALIEASPPVFSFVFGIPSSRVLDACRSRGILTVGTVTTADEAAQMESAGVDVIVATGLEAGGHRVSFLKTAEESLTGTFALIPLVRAAAPKTPLIAAGGIMHGQGIAAALTLGADAAQLGTALLACNESAASTPHREALFAAKPGSTVLTRMFSGRLARGLRNRYVEEMTQYADAAPYPVQGWMTGSFKAEAIKRGRADLISLWAGQGVSLLKHHVASELFADLVAQTSEAFARVHSAGSGRTV